MNAICREANNSDRGACAEIARALPQWFTPNGLKMMTTDLKFQKGFIAEKEDTLVGFISYFVNQGAATIGWMAVLPQEHRNGIGRLLIEHLVSELKKTKISKIFVSTLGDSVDYEPYAKTRAFYRSVGFVDHERIHHKNNPEQEEELVLCREI